MKQVHEAGTGKEKGNRESEREIIVGSLTNWRRFEIQVAWQEVKCHGDLEV